LTGFERNYQDARFEDNIYNPMQRLVLSMAAAFVIIDRK